MLTTASSCICKKNILIYVHRYATVQMCFPLTLFSCLLHQMNRLLVQKVATFVQLCFGINIQAHAPDRVPRNFSQAMPAVVYFKAQEWRSIIHWEKPDQMSDLDLPSD